MLEKPGTKKNRSPRDGSAGNTIVAAVMIATEEEPCAVLSTAYPFVLLNRQVSVFLDGISEILLAMAKLRFTNLSMAGSPCSFNQLENYVQPIMRCFKFPDRCCMLCAAHGSLVAAHQKLEEVVSKVKLSL